MIEGGERDILSRERDKVGESQGVQRVRKKGDSNFTGNRP